MKGPGLQIDERSVAVTRKICTILYLMTIMVLWLDVLWRQFLLKQSLSEFWDLAALMTANVILFVASLLYFGGIALPKIRVSAVAFLYVVCVVVGTGATAYRYRLHSISEILGRMIIVASISGVVVVLYILVAYLGRKKIDEEISE
jgi:hypothetical protein